MTCNVVAYYSAFDEQAQAASDAQPEAPIASCMIGDARQLEFPDAVADGVLMLGPLYHLLEPSDRHRSLSEAYRVLKPGGHLFAAGISRFASTIDGPKWRRWGSKYQGYSRSKALAT